MERTMDTSGRPSLGADVWTVMWKEIQELRQGSGTGRLGGGGMTQVLISVAVFGIVLPLSFGREWVTSPATLLFWAWVPMLLITSVVAQAFAGERERHTLEALLATRLSDRAILLGKIGAAVAYGWVLALASLVLSLITTNVRYGEGELLLYSPEMAASILVITLLISFLAAGAGVLVSLRAATVRQAQQTMSIATMVIVFGSVYGLQALPIDWEALLGQMSGGGLPSGAILAAIGLLLLADVVLLVLASMRFQRARLILD
jgi:ABC-2 type transport system permease protein